MRRMRPVPLWLPFAIPVAFILLIGVACGNGAESTPTPVPGYSRGQVTCVKCHTSRETLARLAQEEATLIRAQVYAAEPVKVSRADKLLVTSAFLNSTHGKIPCQACHNGEPGDEVAAAHDGLVADPSREKVDVCAACHKDIVLQFADTAHASPDRERKALEARSSGGELPRLLAFIVDADASARQATCGQCHVGRPDAVGEGLLSGHQFVKSPPIEDTCLKCHGPKTPEGRYVEADVHWTKARMGCTACHAPAALHGDGEAFSCNECHAPAELSRRPEHFIHSAKVTCLVCHSSGPTTSCSDCHYATKGPQYQEEKAFKIGIDPDAPVGAPQQYVVVGYAPVTRDTYVELGVTLDRYDDASTWKKITPHNVQRATPQNASCNSCHGQEQLFLTVDDLAGGDSRSNLKAVVPSVPQGF